MPPRRGSIAPAILVAVSACGQGPPPATSGAPAEDAVPVYREAMHRLAFSDSLVRILDVHIPAGETTGYHVHANRMVGIAVQDTRKWSQAPGAPPNAVAPAEATPYAFDNWSQSLPYTHRVANVDTIPLHYVVAEWLARAGPEVPSLPDDPSRRLVKEGPTARVYQITLAPGAATTPHTHDTPGLVVLGTAGSLSEEGSTRAKGGSGAGSWSWREAPGNHLLRNDGPASIVVYEVDWR